MKKSILSEIVAERHYQDQIFGVEADNKLKPEDWNKLIDKQQEESMIQSKLTGSYYKFRKKMIQIAALAVAAIEAHDRTNLKKL